MDWLTREITTGFQKLLCLGLERQPAAEVLQGTVQMWMEVLTDGKVWEEMLDADRFRRAFVRYAGSDKHTWPIPADIVALLPPRPEQEALPVKPADAKRAQEYIDNLAKYLGVPTDKVFAESEKPST